MKRQARGLGRKQVADLALLKVGAQAIGSLVASSTVAHEVALEEGLAAIAALLALQYATTAATTRWKGLRRIILSEPTLLYYDGNFAWQTMQRERVTRREVRAAARDSGCSSMSEVAAAMLEPDGNLNVLQHSTRDENPNGENDLLEELHGSQTRCPACSRCPLFSLPLPGRPARP